jgi:hypothetical protein
MLKQRIKQIVPGRYRPFILRAIAIFNAIASLPSTIRFRFQDHKKIVAANLARRDRRVVFVSERPSWREAKLAYGLKRAGWDVIQLHRFQPMFGQSSDFAEMQQFSSPQGAVELAHKAGARVFHSFAPNCDDTCMQMLEHKPGRVIVDFYDDFFALTDGMPDNAKKFAVDIAKQEHCIARADALCCRDLQLQYHRKIRHIGRGHPIIYFPEYCWNHHDLPPPRHDGEIRVVSIGYMGFEKRGENDEGCFRVAQAFVDAGCHFHIYLHPTFPALGTALFKSLFEEYLALQARTGRVHFHATVPPQQIVEELAQYDFGFNMKNGLTFDGIPWTHSNPRRFPYCGSSRLFDYLDAGLGMLVDDALTHMRFTFERYGVLFDGTALVRGNNIRNAFPKRPTREQTSEAKAHLSIERNIVRLTKFYESLV